MTKSDNRIGGNQYQTVTGHLGPSAGLILIEFATNRALSAEASLHLLQFLSIHAKLQFPPIPPTSPLPPQFLHAPSR